MTGRSSHTKYGLNEIRFAEIDLDSQTDVKQGPLVVGAVLVLIQRMKEFQVLDQWVLEIGL